MSSEITLLHAPQVTDASQWPVLCRPSNNVPTSLKKIMSNIVRGPARDRPPACGRLDKDCNYQVTGLRVMLLICRKRHEPERGRTSLSVAEILLICRIRRLEKYLWTSLSVAEKLLICRRMKLEKKLWTSQFVARNLLICRSTRSDDFLWTSQSVAKNLLISRRKESGL